MHSGFLHVFSFRVASILLIPLLALAFGCTSPTTVEDGDDPVLSLDKKILAFDVIEDALPLVVSNAGGGDLEWKIIARPEWCAADPENGLGPAEIKVTVDRSGLDPGDYSATLTIRSNGGDLSIKITMTVPDSDDSGTIVIDVPVPDSTISK